MLMLVAATILIAVNWGVYIWAVNNDQAVEASLGYFINPLVVVLAGDPAPVSGCDRMQWMAVGIAVVAVAVLTAGVRRGAVGRARPRVLLRRVRPREEARRRRPGREPHRRDGVRRALRARLPDLARRPRGRWCSATRPPATRALLMLTGVVTAVPLLLFGAAANRVPLSTIGVLQYISPACSSCSAIFVFGERCPPRAGSASRSCGSRWSCSRVDGLRNGQAQPRRPASRGADGVHEASPSRPERPGCTIDVAAWQPGHPTRRG